MTPSNSPPEAKSPYIIILTIFFGKSSTASSSENLYLVDKSCKALLCQLAREVIRAHGRIAPSERVKRGFGITNLGSISILTPRP